MKTSILVFLLMVLISFLLVTSFLWLQYSVIAFFIQLYTAYSLWIALLDTTNTYTFNSCIDNI